MWISIDDQTEQALRNVTSGPLAVLADNVRGERRRIESKAQEALVTRAICAYTDSSDNIEVDPDAAASETDNGTWVMGWLWLANDRKPSKETDADN